MSTSPIKVGLIGLGRISEKHIEALRSLSKRAALVAVCDSVQTTLSKAVENTGARGYSNLEDMLQKEDLDLVSICTPSGLHPAHGIQVAKSGTHVIVEKPMATSIAQAKELIQTCDENNVKLFVVKQNRFNSTLTYLKQAMDEGRFGRIYMLLANVFWTRPQAYYDQSPWRGTWALDGGAFMNQASHYVDLIRWLGGEVKSVQAKTATLARKIEAEDTGIAMLEFQSGALGNLNVTMLTYPKNLEGSITILGEKGTARVGGVALNRIEHWEFSDKRDEDQKIASHGYDSGSVYGNGHTAFYTSVLDQLEGKSNHAIDGREGFKSLALLDAIYTAAREGRAVSGILT